MHLGGFLQPLVPGSRLFFFCFCLRSAVTPSFWELTSGGIPYSALIGLTVDTWYCQSTEAFVRISYFLRGFLGAALVSTTAVCLVVSPHFAPCFLQCSQALMSHIMASNEPEGQLCGEMFLCRRCRIPVVVQRPIPMVFLLGRPWRLRSCSIFPGGRCPCCAGRVPCPVCASCPCWAFSTTGYSMFLVIATGRLSPSCEQLLVVSDMPFLVARRPVTVPSASSGSCKTSSCTV